MEVKRIGILGGTFNPPHLGHAHAARAAIEALALDLVIWIPAGTPPHKRLPAGTPNAEKRLEMAEAAAEEVPGCVVSDVEIRRTGKSFTCDTVTALSEAYPGDNLFLIIGSDMLRTFESWQSPEVIFAHTRVAVLSRRQDEQKALRGTIARLEEKYQTKIEQIRAPVLEVSSTELRREMALGRGEAHLPPAVFEYIRTHRLYRFDEQLYRIREEVKKRQSGGRLVHILSCEKEAAKLAARWGAEERSARMAALLHDMTKGLPLKVQLNLCKKYGIMSRETAEMPEPVLHAVTGAAVAEKEFGVSECVKNAIRWHTTGRAGMTLLEKIIYLADKIEPARCFPGVEQLRTHAYRDLDGALIQMLAYTADHVRTKGGSVAADTEQALLSFQERGYPKSMEDKI